MAHSSTQQGGFYGAGGARAGSEQEISQRPNAVAHVEDIQKLQSTMQTINQLEAQLESALSTYGSSVNESCIELKASIKRNMTSKTVFTPLSDQSLSLALTNLLMPSPAHQMAQLLDRLEIQGEPVWGLSAVERQLVMEAREKFNSC